MPPADSAAPEVVQSFSPLLLVVYIGLLYVAFRLIRNVSIMRQEPEIPAIRNATGENVPKPKNYRDTDALLRGLNLKLLGIKHSQASYSETGDYFWLYVTPDEQILTEVLYTDEPPQPVAFVTSFADDAMLITAFAEGTDITTPDFSSHFEQDSVEATLTYHKHQVADWTKIHGEPRRIQQVEDSYAVTELYLKRYFRLIYSRRFFWTMVAAAVLVIMLIFYTFSILRALICQC